MHNGWPFQEPFPLCWVSPLRFPRVQRWWCWWWLSRGIEVCAPHVTDVEQRADERVVCARATSGAARRKAGVVARCIISCPRLLSVSLDPSMEGGRQGGREKKLFRLPMKRHPFTPPRACATPSLPGLALSVLAAWFCFGGDVGVVMMLRPPTGARLQHGSLPGRGEKTGRGTMI